MQSKMFKRVFSLVMSAAMVVPAAAVTVSAAEHSKSEYVNFAADNYVDFVDKNRDLIEKVADDIRSFKNTIDIRSYKLSSDYLGTLMQAVMALNPDLFYIDRKYSCSNGSNDFISFIYPEYLYSADKARTMLDAFYSAADHYLELADLSVCSDDFSKAAVLHDELVLDAYYNINSTSNYTFMVNKNGVCENYSRIYSYLLGQIGIYSEIVDSDEMNHEWLKIKIDGSYYLTDLTWDDPTADRPGLVDHTYFLLSDSADQKLSESHYSYVSINKATNTKYDNARYHNFGSKMCKLNAGDTIFYAAEDSSSAQAIVKYNYVSNSVTKVYDLSNVHWSAGGGSYYNGIYSGVDSFGGKIYFNTPKDIYCYDPSSGKTTKAFSYTGSNYLYGMRIKGNVVYGYASSSPNVTGTEVRIGELANTSVDVTSISLDKTSLSMNVGGTAVLNAVISPSNADNKKVTWSSSNQSVAKVSNGTVTAVGAGTAKITAASYNGKTAVCTVTVTASEALKNSSTVSASSVSVNSSVTLTGKASGGTSPYKYAYYYKKSTDSSYTKLLESNGSAYVSNTSAVFKPTAAGTYNIRINVKDSTGTAASKDFSVVCKSSTSVLANNSTVSASSIDFGSSVTLSGKASGGTSPYKYAYYYKKSTDGSYTKLLELNGSAYVSNTSAVFKPTAAGTYNIRINVKDSAGKAASKDFNVVCKSSTSVLTNNSTISSTSIGAGNSVTLTGKASGGTSPYKYAYYYKKSTDGSYTKLIISNGSAYVTNTSAVFKPASAGTYDIRINVKDSNGTTASKEFKLVCGNALVNNSTISASTVSSDEYFTISAKASGGTSPYKYAYYYKEVGDSTYSKLYEENGSAYVSYNAFQVQLYEGTYDIRVNVKDANGTVAMKNFRITVT